MVEQTQSLESFKGVKQRKLGRKKNGSKAKKRPKVMERAGERVKIDRKMKKLFRKRVRDYNSDDEDDESSVPAKPAIIREENTISRSSTKRMEGGDSSEEDGEETSGANDDVVSEDEHGEIQPGITKLTEGCRAFKMAFRSIIKKGVSEESLGPVLSAHTKLVAEKLAEEEAERKTKGEAKKEKQLVGEKGHVKPASFLDSHEKFLISVATKGVVKLFNAVNKAQNAQKGLDPLRSKDAKAIRKHRKDAFFSELRKTSVAGMNTSANGTADSEEPAWAPLRDNYMLSNSKLKNWDKMLDNAVADEIGVMSEDSSSDDD